MPNVILDRIPLPNLKLYTSVSVLLVSCCVYYAISSTSDPFWRLDNNTTASDSFFSLSPDSLINAENTNVEGLLADTNIAKAIIRDSVEGISSLERKVFDAQANGQQQQQQPPAAPVYISPDQRKLFNDTRTIGNKFKDVVSFMVQEPICIWVSKKKAI